MNVLPVVATRQLGLGRSLVTPADGWRWACERPTCVDLVRPGDSAPTPAHVLEVRADGNLVVVGRPLVDTAILDERGRVFVHCWAGAPFWLGPRDHVDRRDRVPFRYLDTATTTAQVEAPGFPEPPDGPRWAGTELVTAFGDLRVPPTPVPVSGLDVHGRPWMATDTAWLGVWDTAQVPEVAVQHLLAPA